MYDPGKILRDQLAARATQDEELVQHTDDASVIEKAKLEAELLSTLHGNIIMVDVEPNEEPEHAANELPAPRSLYDEAMVETNDHSLETDAILVANTDASSAKLEVENIEEAGLGEIQEDVRELNATATSARTGSVDLDKLLDAMEVVDQEDEGSSDIVSQAGEDEDEVIASESEISSSEADVEDEVSFFIDTEGDSTFVSMDIPSTSARPLTMTMGSTPASVGHSGTSTPWARTIEDPVYTEEGAASQRQSHTSHAFAETSARGKRGGRKKREKQEAVQEQLRMDEAYAIHLDYMENSRWRDAGSVAEENDDDDDDHDTPLLAQMLAGLGPANEFGNTLPMDATASEDDDDDDCDEDDSMDEDELEALLDAEESMFVPGKSLRRNRYNAFAEDALFHDDFNVYDYNSDGDDAASLPDLPASGARRRDLNQYVQELDLSDEELEATLIAQWKADKAMKKSRKRDRQQQHADGLIGKRAKRARAAHASNAGSGDLADYHSIIKRFVSHVDYVGVEQLPLPAMDRSIRRAVHIIAQHGYNLQTKSQGSGKRRYPVLYKTKHSSSIDNLPDALFIEEIMVQAQKTVGYTSSIKRRNPNQPAGVKIKGKGKATGGGIGRAAGAGAGKLRDGDIVGVDAPEIAVSNRGRAMLEKLGWSRGSGLGVAGNLGIAVPLTATVKNTRVGLGT
jgi:hypothetical protein